MIRLLVVALAGVWVGMVALVRVSEGAPPTVALLLLGAGSIGLFVALFRTTRNVANAVDGLVDERDRARRDHAHRLAYWALGLPVGLLFGFGVARLEKLALRGEPVVLEASAVPWMAVLLWGAILVWIAAPSAILAWTEPAPLLEETATPVGRGGNP